METKLSIDLFKWIIGTVVSILMAIIGYQFNTICRLENRIASVEQENNSAKVTLARIETQLAQIQVDLTEIKSSLKDKADKN